MGIREEEVEMDWDICAKILKKCFLLTENKQTQRDTKQPVYLGLGFSGENLLADTFACTEMMLIYLIFTSLVGFSFQRCTGCKGGSPGAYVWECAELQSLKVGIYNHWLSVEF